jgi:hypothetical protein
LLFEKLRVMLRVAKQLGTTAVLHVVMLTNRLLMEIAV